MGKQCKIHNMEIKGFHPTEMICTARLSAQLTGIQQQTARFNVIVLSE